MSVGRGAIGGSLPLLFSSSIRRLSQQEGEEVVGEISNVASSARLLGQRRRQLPAFRPTSVASDNTLMPEVASDLAAFLTPKSEDDAVVTVIPPPFMVAKTVSLGEPASLLLQHFKTSGRNFFRKE